MRYFTSGTREKQMMVEQNGKVIYRPDNVAMRMRGGRHGKPSPRQDDAGGDNNVAESGAYPVQIKLEAPVEGATLTIDLDKSTNRPVIYLNGTPITELKQSQTGQQ